MGVKTVPRGLVVLGGGGGGGGGNVAELHPAPETLHPKLNPKFRSLRLRPPTQEARNLSTLKPGFGGLRPCCGNAGVEASNCWSGWRKVATEATPP